MNGKRLVVLAVALALMALQVGYALADGPAMWIEKCPTMHYEVRIEQVDRGAVLVSCVRMAEEVER